MGAYDLSFDPARLDRDLVHRELAAFAWLCDVFVLEADRGRGLARRLVRALI